MKGRIGSRPKYARKRERVEGLDGEVTYIASEICGPLRNGS